MFLEKEWKKKNFQFCVLGMMRCEFIKHSFITYVKKMELNMNFLILKLHNKMESSKKESHSPKDS